MVGTGLERACCKSNTLRDFGKTRKYPHCCARTRVEIGIIDALFNPYDIVLRTGRLPLIRVPFSSGLYNSSVIRHHEALHAPARSFLGY